MSTCKSWSPSTASWRDRRGWQWGESSRRSGVSSASWPPASGKCCSTREASWWTWTVWARSWRRWTGPWWITWLTLGGRRRTRYRPAAPSDPSDQWAAPSPADLSHRSVQLRVSPGSSGETGPTTGWDREEYCVSLFNYTVNCDTRREWFSVGGQKSTQRGEMFLTNFLLQETESSPQQNRLSYISLPGERQSLGPGERRARPRPSSTYDMISSRYHNLLSA